MIFLPKTSASEEPDESFDQTRSKVHGRVGRGEEREDWIRFGPGRRVHLGGERRLSQGRKERRNLEALVE